MFFLGPSAKEIASEIHLKNLSLDRIKRKTIIKKEMVSRIVKCRYRLKKKVFFDAPVVTTEGGFPPTQASFKERVYYEGYPILIKRFYTHHFCNKSGKYLESEWFEHRYVNKKNQRYLSEISNDLSIKNKWKPCLDRLGNCHRFVWEQDDLYLERHRLDWVKDLKEIEVLKNRAVYN